MPARIGYHQAANMRLASDDYRRTEKRLAMNRFYASPRWRRLRRAFLAEHPLCAECHQAGRIEPAIDVHHINARESNQEIAFDWDNLQSLCKACHSKKTRKSRGDSNLQEIPPS
jgi:5-methylcytosine-specific restriction protein A